ncbi:MAG: tyrosine-type recombinase/integrase [Sedimenticolaceae bacterium]
MPRINPLNSDSRRAKLKVRGEPYWHKITKGRFLGYRRRKSDGTWIARYGKLQQRLDSDLDMDYEAALKAAMTWCDKQTAGVNTRYTLEQAIDDYATDMELRKSKTIAATAKQRVKHHLTDTLLSKPLVSLTTAELTRWRDIMVKVDDDPEVVRRSKDSANRTLSVLKAALNYAFRQGQVDSDAVWRRVNSFAGVGEARTLFLADKQVGRLLSHASGAFGALVKAAVLTGARGGELAGARTSDFDPQAGTLHVSGKTGSRDIYLNDDGIAWFKEQAKGKLPAAWLLPNPNGGKWAKEAWRDEMLAARKTAKLPGDTVLYSLRHYHISKALQAGVQTQVIAENCGTSVRMIEKHYGKFLAEDRRAMMNQVSLGNQTKKG